MCGITGILGKGGTGNLRDVCAKMKGTLRHRGPDYSGVWVDEEPGIALGHTRLSIIDLSPHGYQPMVSSCGNYVIVFNGEVYNFASIRAELENEHGAVKWRGHSDTEVVLEAVRVWGLRRTLEKCIGMFAIALWDRRERVLQLARDRMGIKPLYYGWAGNDLVFSSELKAVMEHPGFERDIDRGNLALFFRFSYIPAPYSIFSKCWKLLPGRILTLRENHNGKIEIETFWDYREKQHELSRNMFEGSEEDAVAVLEGLLKDSISLRMIADVPLGTFLSGGIDSSMVVAVMQSLSTRKVRTFSIGFNEERYNEATHAKEVARYLGTDHTELYLSADDAKEVIPSLPRIWDEPFADISQIPTYLVSKLARNSVTVSLSGDGGDELFIGYKRYFKYPRFWSKVAMIPYPIRYAGGIAADAAGTLLGASLPLKAKMERASKILKNIKNFRAFYRHLISFDSDQSLMAGNIEESPARSFSDEMLGDEFDNYQWMTTIDAENYLADDILVKVDRASMAVGLEARVPLIDHRLVEFAMGIPSSMKVKQCGGKWLFRQVLYKYVPRKLIDRPKMGFGVPAETWIRGDLKKWAEDLLNEKILREQGWLNPERVKYMWKVHQSGSDIYYWDLWSVLMFQLWVQEWL